MASIWNARTMFDVAGIVSDAVRDVERRDATLLADSPNPFNASFIIGCRIRGEPPRLFRTFAEGTSSRRVPTRSSSRPARRSTASPSSIASSARMPFIHSAMGLALPRLGHGLLGRHTADHELGYDKGPVRQDVAGCNDPGTTFTRQMPDRRVSGVIGVGGCGYQCVGDPSGRR